MQAVGIEPDGIVGLSLGDLACGYISGCFSAEQVILAAYYCGRAGLESEFIKVSMAVIGKSSCFRHIVQCVCQL
jgi:fatty acid synthase